MNRPVTTYELELVPLGCQYYRADLVHGIQRETLLERTTYPLRDGHAVLLARGASPDDVLQTRHQGSKIVDARCTLGALAAEEAAKAARAEEARTKRAAE